MTKTCSTCKNPRPLSDFHFNRSRKSGYSYNCRGCESARHQLYWKKNGERIMKKLDSRSQEIKTKRQLYYQRAIKNNPDKLLAKRLAHYKITVEQYNYLLKEQKNKCAVCREEFSKNPRRWGIDHDHQTHRIRGILCSNCNSTLGYSKENIRRLQRCLAYLRFHSGAVHFKETERPWFGVPPGGLLIRNTRKGGPLDE